MYLTIIRNRLSTVYITPPTRYLMLKSSIETSSTSHSGEIPAKHYQSAYIPFQKQTCRKTIFLWSDNHESFSVYQKQSLAHFQQEAIYCALQIRDSADNERFQKCSYPTPAGITSLHIGLQIKEIFKYLI